MVCMHTLSAAWLNGNSSIGKNQTTHMAAGKMKNHLVSKLLMFKCRQKSATHQSLKKTHIYTVFCILNLTTVYIMAHFSLTS